MVAKITYGSSIYGAVSYNHHKVDDGTATVIHTHDMISNMNGEPPNLSQIVRSFEDYLSANQRTKTPVAHFSLNPAIDDQLTEDQLKILADEYMKGMGYGSQPYVVYKHNDIDREHIHIVSVRVDETGKKINDSYDYKTSMALCRQLELKYGLKQISNEQTEGSRLFLQKVDYQKGDVKRQISNLLKTLTKDYKFQSFGELNALLSCFNIHLKVVKGEENNNLYQGIIYTATNDNGDLTGKPIKSSLINKSVGYAALEKLIHKESKQVKPEDIHSSKIKPLVLQMMKGSPNKEMFVRNLKKEGIDTVFRQNESGRIYGVTFIEHKNKFVLNGSKLGKEFSANVFNELFNNPGQSKPQSKTHDPIQDYGGEMAPEQRNPEPIFTAPLDDIFGVFYTPTPVNQNEEPAKKKKKKKKRRNREL